MADLTIFQLTQILPGAVDQTNDLLPLWDNSDSETKKITVGDFLSLVGGPFVPTSRTITINGITQDLTANQVWTVGGGGGLTNWSESFSSATQATSQFTPNNAAANVNAAITPKGTGALVAQIPTGTTVGGNARGNNSVDFQMVRNNANQVVSGAGSGLIAGYWNRIVADNSFIGAGGVNSILSGSQHGIVSGAGNTINTSESGFIGAANSCIINGRFSSVVNGFNNQVTQEYGFIGGGQNNISSANYGTIAGGINNRAQGNNSFVGAGASLVASGGSSGIVSGTSNTASGGNSLVGGGNGNTASGSESFVGGGNSNLASGTQAFVGGGIGNQSRSFYSVVGGGYFNTANAGGDGTAVLSGGFNTAGGSWSCVAGGSANGVGTFSFIGGGQSNSATGSHSVVTGGQSNTANAQWATIGGGTQNQATANYAVSVGGFQNLATAVNSTIGGGDRNTASGQNSVIPGGGDHIASGTYSTISGGWASRATAQYSTVKGGALASASLYGQQVFAAGRFGGSGVFGDAQAHELIWRREITGTAQTELFLDGASVRAILPGTNCVWNGIIHCSAVCTNQGNGTTVVGDVDAASFIVTIKRIGTNTVIVGFVQNYNTPNSDPTMGGLFTIDNDNTNESLRIQYTPPGGYAGTTTVIRAIALFSGTQIQY